LGPILEVLFAAHLNTVFRAVALKVLEVCAIPTPWLPQYTTTIALYEASEDEPQTPGASRPAYSGLFIHQRENCSILCRKLYYWRIEKG
jgi:hypothetical protein